MSNNSVRTLLLAAACGGSLAASQVSNASEIRPLLNAGFDFGGDTMVRAVFVDGSTETIKANEGVYLGGGAAILSDQRDWEFHLTLAYKFTMIDAANGDVEWTRFPLEALAFYRLQKVRFGGGLAYHLNPKLEGSGVVGGLNVKFKNAAGAVLQADWLVTDALALGLRYTAIEYDAKGAFTGSAKSNGLGVTFSWRF